MSKLQRVLCSIGLHKWDLREIHMEEQLRDAARLQMSIIHRCTSCGAARIAPAGLPMQTTWVVSEKYAPAKD